MCEPALETFHVTRRVADPRADGGSRIVHVSAREILIERVVQGVRMKVAVPVAGYRGLVLSVRLNSETATLRLAHEDADLDVALASGDAIEVARKAKAWGAVFGKAVTIEEAGVTFGKPFARQRRRAKPSRRSSFSRRRTPGSANRLETSFAGEREIIART